MFFKFIEKYITKGTLEIIDYDGRSYTFGKHDPFCKIKFHEKNLKIKLFINPYLCLGEAIVDKKITIEHGSLEDFVNLITKNYTNIDKTIFHFIVNNIFSKFRFLHQLNFISKSKKNVAHHYDIKEDVYKLFLDKDMQYSCGYFHNDNDNLDQAQIDKKNYLIKKLNIENNNLKVLDIGSGWGGMAIQIAKNTGASVQGITLSENQLHTSRKRIKELNLEELVSFDLKDYRKIKGKYDRIVSVGMFEHVGIGRYRKFFKTLKNLLNENGIIVLHSIGHVGKSHSTNPWIRKYIFPGGYIPSLSEVVKAVETEDLLISDIEILRLHYAKTIKHWRGNFSNNKEKIAKLIDDKFYRIWELYLLFSEYSFRNMGNFVFQMQITKTQQSVPLTRNYLYW